ncbi:alpha-hydroxy acid oxidase [Polaromonas sp. UC242_47]|uniref:alpha-hydroxy acid oxidase n=1 Tax=Polaromonas sp. UC242_47 TaxID=3374626 RepID=UPI0037B58842
MGLPDHVAATISFGKPIVLPARLGHVLSLDDFEVAARRHLPAPVFAYVCGGVERNQSLQANARAFERFEFVTRVLVNTSARSTETSLFGETWSAPFGIAPMGLCALSAYHGDLALANAAARENVPMIMSGSSLIPLEKIVQTNPRAWFQAYLPGSEPEIVALIDRVKAAGYGTLVVTLDASIASNRENNIRAGFSTPLRPSARLAWQGLTHPRWLFGTFLKTLVKHGMPHFENNYARRGAPILSANVLRDFSDRGHLGWEHIRLIRQMWPGKLVLKGILDVRDARLAVENGADGIIVSNHGGRQLDSTVSPMRVLPGIVKACPEIPVMIDSGFRRGTDVLKALALGARFVFVGRPFNYAAAVGGEQGVCKGISLLREEISRDMAMLGVTLTSTVGEDLLYESPDWHGLSAAH